MWKIKINGLKKWYSRIIGIRKNKCNFLFQWQLLQTVR